MTALVADPGPQLEAPVIRRPLQPGSERDLALAERGVDPDVGESRLRRLADQPNVAAQAAAFNCALLLFAGVGVVVGLHHGFQRHRHHQQAEDMRGPRTDYGGEVHLAGGKADMAHLPAVNINFRVGVQVFHIQANPPASPILRDGDRALVPSALDIAKIRALPAWVRVERLVVALHVVLVAGPAGGHLVVTPGRSGRLEGVIRSRLPTP